MPSARHAAIAELANQIRAKSPTYTYPEPAPYTDQDVAIIFKAWQIEYRRRKAAGKVRRSKRNSWRRQEHA
jgi:hypothetical protein